MGFVRSRAAGGGAVAKRSARHSAASTAAANFQQAMSTNPSGHLPPSIATTSNGSFESARPPPPLLLHDQFAPHYDPAFGMPPNGMVEAGGSGGFPFAHHAPPPPPPMDPMGMMNGSNGSFVDRLPAFDFEPHNGGGGMPEHHEFAPNASGASASTSSNAAAAVAAASFLLAANCYDGVLLPSAPAGAPTAAAVAHFGGLENVPQNPAAYVAAAANFYGVGDQCALGSQFPTDPLVVGCPPQPLAVSTATNCNQPLPTMDFPLVHDQMNGMEDASGQFGLPFDGQPAACGFPSQTNADGANGHDAANGMLMTQQPQQLETSSAQGTPTSAAVVSTPAPAAQSNQCAACDAPIHDRFLLCVNGSPYHAECLRCSTCSVQLENEPTCYWKQSVLYCKQCYGQKFQTKCALCDRQIQPTDWVRRARSFVYHLACFSCNHCKRQLSTGEQFSLQENNLLCKQHYLELVQGEDANQKHKIKRVRTTFAEDQLSILQAHFQRDSNPDGADLERIANQTGLSKRVTQVWFQNSRARQKKYQVGGKKATGANGRESGAPGSNSGLSTSPTTTIDSALSPMTKSPSSERHSLLLTSDHLSSAAAAIDGEAFGSVI
ncbi:hypothetical protein M3Y99_01545400 [Aphelenchoides fujianensis]|nr:hypothetical protein M3Y99_01545400 [Aphelenchoides fujianensis]